ncbi:MAG TPA: hypothetical protein VIA62_24820 [Thermoanaerobaculia bacterium]|jgi:hypothetical protein|nr:hypothetical protein [Thermoanaerobaculia bacterium]
MKQLGITVLLITLLAIPFGAASAKAADNTVTVKNDSGETVKVSVVWSGGGLPEFDLAPGTSQDVTVPSPIDSIKTQVTGKCKEAVETFNPHRANRATIQCKDNLYKVRLAVTKPAS